ncbi:uncharacterized protein LOC131284923 [Anopheles ziemanni]|uniref:uncharacterized protein LOC131262371 n=1 Tax=Anopheles coustani TaxID=139045 RepID=UPI002658BD17|nr:uncharacterized protein LOC131262371 [Anopheles coustani]XP_058169765.1 uncharacterized protein LOC131284923 [Anopheles ziemanni]
MASWQAGGEDYGGGAYGYQPYGGISASSHGSLTDGTPRMHPSYETQQQLQQQQQQQHVAWSGPETGSSEIPLLNDDHEKAILSDLCDQAVGESTPLSTFSYISEYICSNNIDIWPGETPGMGCGVPSALGNSTGDPKISDDQRSSAAMSSCMHQQLFTRCKSVLESIIARNEQILELLRQRQHQQQGACKPRRQ